MGVDEPGSSGRGGGRRRLRVGWQRALAGLFGLGAALGASTACGLMGCIVWLALLPVFDDGSGSDASASEVRVGRDKLLQFCKF